MASLRKKPWGLTFCIGLNANWIPMVHLGKTKLETLRPVLRASGKLQKANFGFRLDFLLGYIVSPYPKFYRWDYWFSKKDDAWKQKFNPWNTCNRWFLLKFPIPVPSLFFSYVLKISNRFAPGGYIGVKTYQVNDISACFKDYAKNSFVYKDGKCLLTWAKAKELGNIYLCPSASPFRKNFYQG